MPDDATSRVLLKPSFEGSSKGIRAHCLASSSAEAWSVFCELAASYRQPILIEEFIQATK